MTIPMNATAAFSYLCITVIFRNEFTVFLVVEQSSLARKGQLQKCVIYFVNSSYEGKYLLCYSVYTL